MSPVSHRDVRTSVIPSDLEGGARRATRNAIRAFKGIRPRLTSNHSVALALILCATPGSAGAQAPAGRPLQHSIDLEAFRLASISQPPSSSAWQAVSLVKPGTSLQVTFRDGTHRRVTFLEGAPDSLVVLLPVLAAVPGYVPAALVDVAGRTTSEYMRAEHGEMVMAGRGVRFGPEGVFGGPVRFGDYSEFIRRIAKSEIVEIRRLDSGHRGQGATIGALIGLGAAVMLVESRAPAGSCNGCAGYIAAFGVIFGGIGAGIGAGIGGAGALPTVIYRDRQP